MRHALIILCLLLVGCAKAPKQDVPPAVMLNWSGETIPDGWIHAWYVEARKRFDNPVIVACHGNTVGVVGKDGKVDKVWMASADPPRKALPIQQIAEVMANIYPDRDVVYICCNEGGHKITVPRAWVAPAIVWAMPDSFPGTVFWRETKRGCGYVGSIYEFECHGRVRLAGER
jgi:hypothetical protein